MSFIDGIKGQVSSMLSGGSDAPPGLIGSVMGFVNSQPGGLGGLVEEFKDKGLGATVSSWVGAGPNQPINPEQIQQVLGNERLQQLASEHGINLQEVSTHLAQILPMVVDKMTPNGTIPTS